MIRPALPRLLRHARRRYRARGYMYSGGVHPRLVARELGLPPGDAVALCLDAEERGLLVRRTCQSRGWALPATERLRLIEKYDLARRWERNGGACFYPNSFPHGEIPTVRLAAARAILDAAK